MTEHDARAATQAAANGTGRAQNLITSGVPGQYRMLDDNEMREWRVAENGYTLLFRAVPQ